MNKDAGVSKYTPALYKAPHVMLDDTERKKALFSINY